MSNDNIAKVILMSTHNIGLYKEISKIMPKLSLNMTSIMPKLSSNIIKYAPYLFLSDCTIPW